MLRVLTHKEKKITRRPFCSKFLIKTELVPEGEPQRENSLFARLHLAENLCIVYSL